MTADLAPGQIWWAYLGEGVGREQGGRRPVVVVSAHDYNDSVDALAIVMPLTKVRRGWPNHVKAQGDLGIRVESWIMTEQVRAVSRDRLKKHSGSISQASFDRLKWWASVFLGLPTPQ